MTEYERRMVEAVERLAAAVEALAAEPERQREHDEQVHGAMVDSINYRQAVEGVAEVVDLPEPAEERVEAAREIVRGALERGTDAP